MHLHFENQNARMGKLLALLLVVVLGILIVPVILVGDCAHPFGDDYAFSVFFHQALEDGASGLGALAYTVKRYYFGWQGTYAAAVLMALQPGVWSEQAYLLTSVVMLFQLIVPTAFLTNAILRRWLALPVWQWIAVTAGLSIITILYQPSATQAFFWWNGSVFYTFFYGMMLLLITCLIRLRLNPSHPHILMTLSLALAVVIGGGNYVTALFTCLLLWGYALICLIWDRKRLWQPLLVGVVFTVCFAINALAPGNSVRQNMSTGMSIPDSVITSMIQVLRDSKHWINLPILCFYLCMIPVLWKGLGRTKFSFPWPVAATILLFLAMASQNTPHFFAMSTEGPGRLRNIVFDSWIWLLLLGEGYWIGWFRHKFTEKEELSSWLSKALVASGLFLALVGSAAHFSSTSTGKCLQVLSDGSARAYDTHLTGWVELLNGPETDVVLPQFENPPELLYMFQVTSDPEVFANIAAANYYGKNTVIAVPADSELLNREPQK